MSRLHPNDWAECRLGDITFESSIRLKDTDYVGLPVYGVDNVVGLNPTPRYTADNFERYKVVEHGMFAYNPMRLNIGSIGYSFNYHPTCLVSPDYVVFGCRAEYLFSDFLYHHIKSQRWVDQTKNSGSGSVRFRIYYETLADFRIVLPPLTEQRKIAAILSTWDEAIALTEQLTAALGRRKQALMQLLLTGDVRFAGFEGSEWEAVLFGEVATINPPKPNHIDGESDVSFITMADVSEEARLINMVNRKYSEVKNGFTGFQDGDVLIAKITPCFENGKGALVEGLTNGVGFGSTEFHIARANPERIIPQFIYYHTITHNFRGNGEANMSGSAGQKRIPTEFIRSYRIFLPSLSEQQKIVDVLEAMICPQ